MSRIIDFIKTHKVVIVLALILGIIPNLMVHDYSKEYNEEVAKIKTIQNDTEKLYDDKELKGLKENVKNLKDENAKLEKEIQAKQK
ncbi:hypothetical protein GNF80_03780 [Clostridium perfringens]|nr:hypothetical protein [Clostridium perfringens]